MLRSIYRNIKNFVSYCGARDKKIGKNVATHGSKLEGKNKICENTVFVNSRLGRGSYMGANCSFNAVEIGRYCSIGSNVKIITGNHPTRDFVSTHPAFFSLSKQAGFSHVSEQRFEEQRYLDRIKNVSVSIGNDVWIGEDVIIIGGIKINDGAIIGARALVTRDIPAFAKVAGVPAKVIGKRFNDEQIEFLLKLKWWEKNESWIIKHAPLFSNVTDFMKSVASES